MRPAPKNGSSYAAWICPACCKYQRVVHSIPAARSLLARYAKRSYRRSRKAIGAVTWLVIWCRLMNPDAGRAWFRIAMTITLVSAVLVYVTEPGTAERIVSIITLLIGLLFSGTIIVLVRRDHS